MAESATILASWIENDLSRRKADRHSTIITGLIGRSIQASRTPMMHELEAQRLRLNNIYMLLDFDKLQLPDSELVAALETARDFGFSGVNITHPFKTSIIPLLDNLSVEAAAIGAVNTVVLQNGTMTGHNTDCWGFSESMKTELSDAKRERVILFGAGGAGAAVAYALSLLGVKELIIIDELPERAENLATKLNQTNGCLMRATTDINIIASTDGVVNATPIGMDKYPGTPFPTRLLTPQHWVAEIIYFPLETELLRQARAIGCQVMPGIGMAIGQAVRAFELFTGLAADKAAMAAHFEAAA